ncbi:MAG: PAS domain S-box protein, partial [Bacteroidota bacterium]
MSFKEMTMEQLIIELERMKVENAIMQSQLEEENSLRLQLEKQVEEALQNSENSYFGLFNSVSEAIYIHKADGIFLDVNEGAVKMYGYSREELIGMKPAMVAAPGKKDMEIVMDLMKI